MKLLFVHGGEKLKEDSDGNLYTSGSYNDEIWNRYLEIFDNLTVIARKELTIYEPEYARQNFHYFNKEKIRFIEIPNLSRSYKSFLNLNKRKIIRRTLKQAVLENDYIIARIPSSAGYLAAKYAKGFKKPYFLEVVGCAWDALWNYNFKGKILAPIRYLQMKKTVKKSPYTLYVSNIFLQSRYPTNGLSVGCSDVDLPNLDEQILKNRLDKIYNMQSIMSTVIGTIGAVDVKYKGQEYVIEAISKLNMKGYNFEYHIVGGGDSKYLRDVAKKYNVLDQVKFHGSLPHEEIFKWLDTIDIYIQPSMTEGLPRALVEAMSRGCPSIGSNVGGIPELVSSEFIFKAKDVNDLLEKLIKMNKENMLKEAEKNFNKAKEFDKHLLNKKRIEFYRSFKEGINSHD